MTKHPRVQSTSRLEETETKAWVKRLREKHFASEAQGMQSYRRHHQQFGRPKTNQERFCQE
jgi:hypothetical protein